MRFCQNFGEIPGISEPKVMISSLAMAQRSIPASVNWQSTSARGFPYRVVQPPGPQNALGLVKFMFPNKYNVYLHDTPGRQLFSKTGRAFSHGCVRVQDPMKFAELLLRYRNGMTRQKIDRTVASGKRTRVNLTKTYSRRHNVLDR